MLSPQVPQTEQQNLKCGSISSQKSNFNASVGRNFLAYLIIPIAQETFADTDSTC